MKPRESRLRRTNRLRYLRWLSLASLLLSYSLCFCDTTAAGDAGSGSTDETLSPDELAYREAIERRAEKIVAALELNDSERVARVRELVAEQYRNLRDIHDSRDRELADLAPSSAKEMKSKRNAIETATESELLALHRRFVARLAAELNSGEVDRIKDGMTYDVVSVTYNAYLELLPDLTEDEKRHIKSNLLEAREYAMDAGSSEEKHAWFGKYKGHINNFLSKAGYDLKQAEKDLSQRRREKETTSPPNARAE